MSYSLEQGNYSSTGSSSPSLMDSIEGNEFFNARDTTHERPTLEEPESLDDIEAAILDPRNKMKLINFSFCVMYSEDEAPRQIRMVRNSLYELYKEYVDEYATANVNTTMESDVQESGVINTCTTSRIGKGKVLTGRSKFERCIRSVDRIHNVKSELDIYLGEGMFICKEECIDFDALEWWKANNLKF
ncbi:hypothetical protein V6N13_092981 [Hibiscus sabdariffa]